MLTNCFSSVITLGAGQLILRPYAASVMTPEAGMIADIKGERGNPWAFPTNPGQINIQRASTGRDWGCWAVGTRPIEYDAYFYFIPPGNRPLFAYGDIHFSRILYSAIGRRNFFVQDGLCDRRCANERVQYAYLGWKTFPLIDRHEDNVSKFTSYDHTNFFDYTAFLKAGDPVFVAAKVRLDCLAIFYYW